MAKGKILKKWNGRAWGRKYSKGYHFSVAAYSAKQARELIMKAADTYIPLNEISAYYSPCWGNNMEGIEPAEPSVYASFNYGKGERIL